MLPFSAPEEPWDRAMEVFGVGASSGEVSVVAGATPSFPRDPGWGPRRKGRGAGEQGAQASPLEAAGPTALSLSSGRG